MGWRDIVGDAGRIISINHYGESADAATLFREFGFTPGDVVDAAQASIRSAAGK
jgi:transketolase